MTELTESESIIISFNDVLSRLIKSNYFFEELVEKAPDFVIKGIKSQEVKKMDLMFDVLLEYSILQITNFFEILPKLSIVERKTFDNAILSKSLKIILEQIQKNESKIKIWRNKVVAHSKEQSRDYIPYYIRDQDYVETFKNVLLTSRLIVHYGTNFLQNLPTDYDMAKIVVRFQNMDVETFPLKKWWSEMKKNELAILENTNNVLRVNGLEQISTKRSQNMYKDLF